MVETSAKTASSGDRFALPPIQTAQCLGAYRFVIGQPHAILHHRNLSAGGAGLNLVIVRRTLILLVFALSVATVFSRTVSAAESQIKIAQPGQNITVWDGWNVNGTIFVKIDGGPGDDCIKLWWIKMGLNSDTWEVCNQTEINVNLPLIYGELRAGHFQRQTAVAVSDNASVAYSVELCDRVIDC